VVARFVDRQEHFRVAWIACRFIKIDHGIVPFARPNPLIKRLALCFADVGVICRTVERRQRRPIDLQPSRVRLFDELLVPGDEVFGRRGWVLPGNANVVDSFQHDDVRDTRLRQGVALEAGQGIDASNNGANVNSRRSLWIEALIVHCTLAADA
jgi:hypothetical protein